MTDTTPPPMPSGLIARARWAAGQTPPTRNRAVDLYRAIAIGFVIFGHWLLIAPWVVNGEARLSILLAEQPAMQYATWVAQVMPVFFFVGGFANGLSWSSARRDPMRARAWAATRLARLLTPTVPLVLVWAVAALLGPLAGLAPETVTDITRAALVPIWFLAVYIVITVAVPVSWAAWERFGFGSVAALALGAIAVDAIAFGLGQGWLRWANYGFVWLAVHQLGYWWLRPGPRRMAALALVALGVVWTWVLLGPFGYPVSMVSVPGAEVSNTRPPTTAMLSIGAVQIGLILLAEPIAARWLRHTGPWSWVILVNQMIMTIYLWHMTALLLLLGLSWLAGGIGLGAQPGTAAWWALRPVWMLVLMAALVPLVLTFMRFEAAVRAPAERLPGPARATLGALLTCGGLVMMALGGTGGPGPLGVNWIAVALVVGGVLLATRPRSA
jgi:hypothetical protein